jgi:hypothetical protein
MGSASWRLHSTRPHYLYTRTQMTFNPFKQSSASTSSPSTERFHTQPHHVRKEISCASGNFPWTEFHSEITVCDKAVVPTLSSGNPLWELVFVSVFICGLLTDVGGTVVQWSSTGVSEHILRGK